MVASDISVYTEITVIAGICQGDFLAQVCVAAPVLPVMHFGVWEPRSRFRTIAT
jgi:hypothetical protein